MKKHRITITLDVKDYRLAEVLYELGRMVDEAYEDTDMSKVKFADCDVTIDGFEEYIESCYTNFG